MAEYGRAFGREAFGADPSGYAGARPGYPSVVWDVLRTRCGLGPQTRVLEIGPGPGVATGPLLDTGAEVVAVEPDARLAQFLTRRSASPKLQVINAPFETAVVLEGEFDIACAFTAFHWLDPAIALPRIRALLRSGGWWAPCWNIFGDPERPDPFHEATLSLLQHVPAPFGVRLGRRTSDSHDVEGTLAEIGVHGFVDMTVERFPWTLHLDADQARALYSTFSNVNALPPEIRERVLDGLAEIAQREFGNHVTRNMLSILYIARRP